MYCYLNLHPKGKLVRDCVKRAIAGATGMDYMEVARQLNRAKKITHCDVFNERKNIKYYLLEVLHATELKFPAVKGASRMNGERFSQMFPDGRYVLNMAGHLSCCVNGIIYDTWDCSDKCVYSAYRING